MSTGLVRRIIAATSAAATASLSGHMLTGTFHFGRSNVRRIAVDKHADNARTPCGYRDIKWCCSICGGLVRIGLCVLQQQRSDRGVALRRRNESCEAKGSWQVM